MILKIEFRASEDFRIWKVQEKISSVLYKILSTTELQNIHDSSYTQFSFSPFYPFIQDGRFYKNEIYSIEIRSPNFDLIDTLHRELQKREFIELDYNRLYLDKTIFQQPKLNILKVKSISPVVISVSDKMAEKYRIEKRSKTLYWLPKMNFQLFIDSLNRNMVRKWNRWNEKQYDENLQIIGSFKLLKNFPIMVDYKKGRIAGTLWEFELIQEFPDIIKFNYLSGFGEKSGSGFGFVN